MSCLTKSAVALAAVVAASAVSAASFEDSFVTSGVATLGLSAQNSIRDSIHAHTLHAVSTSRADGGELWLDVDLTSSKTDSLYEKTSGAKNKFYMTNLGADIKLGDSLFGVVYNWGQGDSKTRGEAAERKGDQDFFGVKIYGAQSFNVLTFTGALGYMRGRGSADYAGGRYNTNADYTTLDLGAFVTLPVADWLKVQPYAQVNTTYLHADGNRAGGDTHRATLFQAPVGVRLAGTFPVGSWTMLPTVDLSVVPSFGDKHLTVDLPSGNRYNVDWTNKTLYRSTIGLELQHEKGTLGLDYTYTGADEGREDNTLRLTGRYVF